MKALDNGTEANPVYLTEYYPTVNAHAKVALGVAAEVIARPAGSTQILVQAITQNIRFRLDGVSPDATTGFRITAGNDPIIIGVAGADIRFFREAAGAELQYQWLR